MHFQIHDEVRYSDTFVATFKHPEMRAYMAARRGVMIENPIQGYDGVVVTVMWDGGQAMGMTLPSRLTLVRRPPTPEENQS